MLSSLMVASYLTEKNEASPEIEGYRSIDHAWLPLFEMSYEENESYESRYRSLESNTLTKSSNSGVVSTPHDSEHPHEMLSPSDPHLACNRQFCELRSLKEVSGQIKYFFVDNESGTSQIKLVCESCIKSATCTDDAGEPVGGQNRNVIRPWVEKVPTISEREWNLLNSSEIFEHHCNSCNVKLSNVFHSWTENSQKLNRNGIESEANSDRSILPMKLLQFSEFKHSIQFFRLIKKIKHQVNYFSVESDPRSKKLSLICTLCNKSLEHVTTAARHVSQKEHLLRCAKNCANLVMLPMITDDYWKFLMPRRDSEDFMCYLCHAQLSNSPFSWWEHFQSESHVVLKSQQLQNDASDSDTCFKCTSVESFEKCENSVLVKTNRSELYRSESSSFSCNSTIASFAYNNKKSSDILEVEKSRKTVPPPRFDRNTLNFKFTQFSHVHQFLRIIKKINDQINCFSFESRPASKKLKLTCMLCSESGDTQSVKTCRLGSTVTAAASHVKEKEHLLNLSKERSSLVSARFIPTISEGSWNCIVPQSHTESFACTLCNLNLRKSSFKGPSMFASRCINSWVDHLQSETHLLKLANRDFDKENSCHNLFNNGKSSILAEAQTEYWLAKQKSHKKSAKEQSKASFDGSSGLEDCFSRNKIKVDLEKKISSNNDSKDYSSAQGTDDESIFDSSISEKSKNSIDQNLNRVSVPSPLCGGSYNTINFYNNSHVLEIPKCKNLPETLPEQQVFDLEGLNENTLEAPVTSTEDILIQEETKLIETCNDTSIDYESVEKKFPETPSLSEEPEPLPDLFQDLFDLEFEQNSSQEQLGDDSTLDVPLPENLFQDTFDFDSLKFRPKTQKERFENLTKELNYQINYFSFDPHTTSQKMTLICKLCNKSIHVSEAEKHANDQEHLKNLFSKGVNTGSTDTTNLNDENWQFLDFIPSLQEYLCTLCSVKLPNDSDSWAAHFCSKTHSFKLAESQTFKNKNTHSDVINKSEALNKNQKEKKSSLSESNLKDHSASKSVNELGKSVKSYTAEKATHSDMISKSEVLINHSDRKSTGESIKFKSNESKSNFNEHSDCKVASESQKLDKNYAQAVSNSNSPKKITNLESVFKFVKIDSYFSSFPYLNRGDQICLKRNCKFILVDIDSKEVFCTACHYFFFVKSEDEKTSLKNLTFHFTSLHHKKEAHKYGPAAYFQKNISSILFFENNTGFCRVCQTSLPNCAPQDIDILLGHFESMEHGDLIRAACNYNDPTYSTKVNNDLVTLFISKKKYDSRVVYTSKISSQKSE